MVNADTECNKMGSTNKYIGNEKFLKINGIGKLSGGSLSFKWKFAMLMRL